MSYFAQQEYEQMLKDKEEDLINQQMMYDELYSQKETLEDDIAKITNQLSENKINPTRDNAWKEKAKQALEIKKIQRKKISRQIQIMAEKKKQVKIYPKLIDRAIRDRLIKEIGEEEFLKFVEQTKQELEKLGINKEK